MPGTFLTAQERERLAGFPDDIPHRDLITSFTLTEHDCSLIDTYHSDANRLGTALQLCAVRYLGFCPAHLQAAPMEIMAFLARQLQTDPTVLQTDGLRRMTRSAHCNAVLNHLGFRRVQPEDHEPLLTWLTERALEHDQPTLLVQTVCEHLKQQHWLRPAVTTLERWVITARMQAHHESLRRLQPLLTPDRMALLDHLLVPEPDTGKTLLSWLRQHATSNTPPALLDALNKLTRLQQWEVDQWEMAALNPNRQKFLTRRGRKYTMQALRRTGPERRYPILLSLLKQTLMDLTDESVDIFDVCLASRHKKAREGLKDYQYEIAEAMGTHSQLLQTIGALVLDDEYNPTATFDCVAQICPCRIAVLQLQATRESDL